MKEEAEGDAEGAEGGAEGVTDAEALSWSDEEWLREHLPARAKAEPQAKHAAKARAKAFAAGGLWQHGKQESERQRQRVANRQRRAGQARDRSAHSVRRAQARRDMMRLLTGNGAIRSEAQHKAQSFARYIFSVSGSDEAAFTALCGLAQVEASAVHSEQAWFAATYCARHGSS